MEENRVVRSEKAEVTVTNSVIGNGRNDFMKNRVEELKNNMEENIEEGGGEENVEKKRIKE